ncbi:MAG: tRNA (adenosine(37)-N6)-dimethylallyltransferase MiaA [Spirochaetaceae bacterium]|nr:tRNA (adenosine(37)-N6)-dimethylallyltransferase MiaA [Spirochaetaceae bacterium]
MADQGSFPVFILFGPTGSGKTALLEKLFTGSGALCPAEVVSADSMQVYRGMDIGTAKPDAALLARLPHHLIDIRNPGDQFNAGDFVRLAAAACGDIAARGKFPVISGGTGFYLKSFISGLGEDPSSDPLVRRSLREELLQKGPGALFEELARRDPASAERIHVNDLYRLLRALEVCRVSGRPLSSFAPGKGVRGGYRFVIAGLRRDRQELYRRIELRCEDMFRRGLAAEVEELFSRGYTPRDPGLRAIGYREFFEPLPGEGYGFNRDTEGVKALVKRNSRRYAKRQETFFASIPEAVWLPPAGSIEPEEPEKTLDLFRGLLHTFLKFIP